MSDAMADHDDAVTGDEPAPREASSSAGGDGNGADAAAEVLEHDLEQLLAERGELLDLSRRLQADFENYRKRVLREQTALVERATEGLIEQLLPVLDSFELAVANLERADDDTDDNVRKGVELTFASLLDVLGKQGLERVAATGVSFDPNEHEAVLQEEGDGEPVVAEVLRTGWKLKGRVLRPAMVKVAHHGEERAS
ncbi:MAG TPA: nucleotide exchange factor GrpE [Acidimicrobiia bacterium]|nr:nucleotide exchange factor GrpE [Acidimicrobiia bacterium]